MKSLLASLLLLFSVSFVSAGEATLTTRVWCDNLRDVQRILNLPVEKGLNYVAQHCTFQMFRKTSATVIRCIVPTETMYPNLVIVEVDVPGLEGSKYLTTSAKDILKSIKDNKSDLKCKAEL